MLRKAVTDGVLLRGKEGECHQAYPNFAVQLGNRVRKVQHHAEKDAVVCPRFVSHAAKACLGCHGNLSRDDANAHLGVIDRSCGFPISRSDPTRSL